MTDAALHILETAGRLFGERGYELVGINEIIEKSGVAKATYYAHFKSKEKLCVAWLKESAAHSEASGKELLNRKVDGLAKVEAKFESLRNHCKVSDFRGCPFSITASMTKPSSEVRDVIRDYKASARVFWQSLALEVKRDPSEARALGDAMFLLYSGAVTEAQNCRNSWPVDAAKTAALKLCTTT